jgi:hypothetical protein
MLGADVFFRDGLTWGAQNPAMKSGRSWDAWDDVTPLAFRSQPRTTLAPVTRISAGVSAWDFQVQEPPSASERLLVRNTVRLIGAGGQLIDSASSRISPF